MAQKYESTFTNGYGDRWLFEYDPATDSAIVKGSDVDDAEYKVIEGVAYNLVMHKEEREWLLSTWEEAAGRKSSLEDLAEV